MINEQVTHNICQISINQNEVRNIVREMFMIFKEEISNLILETKHTKHKKHHKKRVRVDKEKIIITENPIQDIEILTDDIEQQLDMNNIIDDHESIYDRAKKQKHTQKKDNDKAKEKMQQRILKTKKKQEDRKNQENLEQQKEQEKTKKKKKNVLKNNKIKIEGSI